MSTTIAPGTGFVHPALVYADIAEYLAVTVPYIRSGLAAGEPVMVAVPADNLEHIRDALGPDAARVDMHDMSTAGRNPGRIIPGVLLPFAADHPGRRARIIGEPIWAGRTETEYPACAQHEALINAAFAGRCATILCPYDAASLDQRWLDDALRTHPVVQTASETWESVHYGDPITVAAGFNQPLPPPPADAATMAVDRYALAAIRRFITAQATAAGLPPDRVVDMTVAVNELASNTVLHTGADGTLWTWAEADHVACQLADTGHLSDPLTGRIPVPPHLSTGGRGLVLVNQLCDLVRIHTRPGATTIRVHMHR
jgi:anti-sigma regulatory factor (Ser/Thr protein kinase)